MTKYKNYREFQEAMLDCYTESRVMQAQDRYLNKLVKIELKKDPNFNEYDDDSYEMLRAKFNEIEDYDAWEQKYLARKKKK